MGYVCIAIMEAQLALLLKYYPRKELVDMTMLLTGVEGLGLWVLIFSATLNFVVGGIAAVIIAYAMYKVMMKRAAWVNNKVRAALEVEHESSTEV